MTFQERNEKAKSKSEQNDLLFAHMYESAKQKMNFWLSLNLTLADAIEKAKKETCAGSAVWERIEAEFSN